jgi:hypothetical protein
MKLGMANWICPIPTFNQPKATDVVSTIARTITSNKNLRRWAIGLPI